LSGTETSRMIKVLKDEKEIIALANPIRRENLMLLMEQPMTLSQLAKELHMTTSTVSYHLNILSNLGMIRIQRTEVERHGILSKYYEATARIFIEDYRCIPQRYQKHFYEIHMERLRGALAMLYLFKKERGEKLEVSSEKVKKLAKEIAEKVSRIGEDYQEKNIHQNREKLIIEIYSKALEGLIKKREH